MLVIPHFMTRQRLTYLLILVSTIYFGQSWQWAKSGNGSGGSEGVGVATDANGNVYVTGAFNVPNIVFGSNTLTSIGNQNVFLTKYDANGNVLWAKNSINGDYCVGYSISTDANENVYLVGLYGSPTIVFGSFTLVGSGNGNVFLVKYDATGNVLWAKNSIGSGLDCGFSVSTDPSGNVYITGFFKSSTITLGTYTLTNSGISSTFIAKYDANGNVLWAKNSVNSGDAQALSAKTDVSGNVYITGFYASPAIVFGSYTLTGFGSPGEVFLTKYNSNGNVLWAKSSIASSIVDNTGYSVVTDLNGNAYITGYFSSPTISFGTYTLTNTWAQSIFLIKYDSNGNVLWAKNSNGSAGSGNKGYSLSLDANNIYLSGGFQDTLKIDTYTLNPLVNSADPMFIARFDLNGNINYISGLTSGGDDLNSIAVDKHCNVYIGADFLTNANPNFIVGTNTLTPTGIENVFVAKLSFSCDVGINELSIDNKQISLYPNPNSGTFQIQINIDIKNGQLILINSIGQKVHEQKIIQGTNEIQTNGLPFGLYNCILFQDNQTIKNGKLTIE